MKLYFMSGAKRVFFLVQGMSEGSKKNATYHLAYTPLGNFKKVWTLIFLYTVTVHPTKRIVHFYLVRCRRCKSVFLSTMRFHDFF